MTSVLSTLTSWLPGSNKPSTLPRSADSSTSDRILSSIGSQLARSGFDIAEPLCIGWYNDAVSELPESQIPLASETGTNTLALLVGNSKVFWEHFLEACIRDSSLLNCEDPVEQYTERVVAGAVAAGWSSSRIFYSHEQSAGQFSHGFVAMQRLAELTGCAYNDHSSHLSLHRRYGTWFALRALIVFDGVEYRGQPKLKPPNPLSSQTQSYVRTAVRSARTCSSSDLSDMVLGGKAEDGGTAAQAMRKQWRKWVAVRDAPFPGHPWRYPEAMLTYHYTNERRVLRDAVKAHLRRRSCNH